MIEFASSGDLVVCKLKQIRPFTESQLFGFFSNPELDKNDEFVHNFIQEALKLENCKFYQTFVELNKLRDFLAKTTKELDALRNLCNEERNKVWLIRKNTAREKGKCADGRTVEGVHSYNVAVYQEKYAKSLETNQAMLRQKLTTDYCHQLFMVQMTKKEIEYEIFKITTEKDAQQKVTKIKSLLSALFAFHRRMEIEEDTINCSIKQWICQLVASLLPIASREETLFLLNHILRCPGNVTSWATSFIQCPSPLHASSFPEAIHILNHGMNIICTILSPIRARDKFLKVTSKSHLVTNNVTSNDEYWHLIDVDVDEGEDVLINRINLTESDIIELLQQVPYDDLLKFLTEKHIFPDELECGIVFGEYSETTMIKLLAISTKMVQILRKGLMTFNCMKFRALTGYITHLIRKTVTSVSKFWQAYKGSFKSKDDALVLRLQVEYDHFILRSVVTILSSQRFGVWKFVSAIPFNGVTESMMWHIVWVFYNNGRDEIDELGGLCPYFSDLYWKSKFNEPAMKFLFREKLPSLSSLEAECLLRSLGNMIISRNSSEIEFINTIAVEIFEITFLTQETNEEIIPASNKVLSKSIKKHPFIISALIRKIKEVTPASETLITPFEIIPSQAWLPTDDILDILGAWLCDYSFDRLLNKLARVILTRLNYHLSDQNNVHLSPQEHRKIAVLIFKAIIAHSKPEDSFESHFKNPFAKFDIDYALKRARGKTLSAFLEWAWRIFLLLKLHIKDYPNNNEELTDNLSSFHPVPNIITDCDMFVICKGYEGKNPFALYLTIMMSKIGHSDSHFDDGIDIMVNLLSSKCFIPCLNALHGFIPTNHTSLHSLATNSRFLNSFLSILLLDTSIVVDCLLGLIQRQIRNEKDKREIIHFWIEILCESTNCIFLKYSSSWFGSSSRGLRQLVHIINELVAFVFHDDNLITSLIEVFAGHLGAMECVKSSNGISRLLPWSSGPKKCDWTTPFHYLLDKEPDKVWLAYLLIKADSLRMEKIWESVVVEMGSNMDITGETAIRSICERFCYSPIPINILPINAWAKLITDTPIDHNLMPLHFYNFFSCFFANSTSGGSCGLRLVPNNLLQSLRMKIDLIIQDHVSILTEKPNDPNSTPQSSDELFNLKQKIKFYRASLLWLQDLHLHDAFIDIEHLPNQYQIDILKNVMNSTESYFRTFVDYNKVLQDCEFYSDLWISVKTMKCELQPYQAVDEIEKEITEYKSKSSPPPDEQIPSIKFYDIDLIDSLKSNPSSLLNYINFNIKVILDEKNNFDGRSLKIHNLSIHLMNTIASLYENTKKELKVKASCDTDGAYIECSGPVFLTIEFSEAQQNATNHKSIQRNRIEFENMIAEMLELPSDKTVCAAIFLHRSIPAIIKLLGKVDKEDPCEKLVRIFISQIDTSNPIVFSPAKNIFNLLVENLDFENNERLDLNSIYLLETSLAKASLIEYLASRLVPSKCSTECFLKMYQLISSNLYQASPNILFVLLSKFDVTSWLNNATDEDCDQLINLLINSLCTLGKTPEDDKMMILGLYRKHLQHMVICRFPKFLVPIINHLLKGMNNFAFYPQLWDDILLSFGYYSTNQKTQIDDIVAEMKKYAESQPIFSSAELSSIVLLFYEHFNNLKTEKVKIDLIELFADYVPPISTVVSTISYMWIYVNLKEDNTFDNTSKMFYLLWKPWLVSDSSKVSVDKSLFDRMWDFFIFNLHYFLSTWNQNCTDILSQAWNFLVKFFLMNTATETFSEGLQMKLINLPWSNYSPTQEDIKLMYDASQHEQCPPVILVSHIIRHVNWRNCIKHLPQSDLSKTMEWLASTVIFLADKPDSFHLDSLPLFLIKSEQAKEIRRHLYKRTKLSSLIYRKYDIHHMYIKMMKIICEVGPDSSPDKMSDDTRKKHLIYMDFVYGIILDAVRSDPSILKEEGDKVTGFLKSCINDIRPCLQSDRKSVTAVFTAFLGFIDSATINDPQNKLLDVLFELVKGTKELVMEVLICSQSSVKFFPLFITITEKCIDSYAEVEGTLDAIMQHFSLPNKFHSSIYKICHQNQAYLTLFVIYHLEKDKQNLTDLLPDMIDWSRHLKPDSTNESKILGIWYMLIKEICSNISAEESHNKLLTTAIKLIKQQLSFAEEITSQGFLSFIKFNRKYVPLRACFLTTAMAAFLLKRLIEEIPSFHPLFGDIPTLHKFSISKLQSIKKDKGFSENNLLVEKCLELVESENRIEMEGIKLLNSWLLAFYSGDAPFRFILSSSSSSSK